MFAPPGALPLTVIEGVPKHRERLTGGGERVTQP
jgi:hypothetical protein